MFLSIFNNFFPIINKSQTPLLLLEDQGKLRRDNTVSKSYNTLAGFLYIFKYPPPGIFFDELSIFCRFEYNFYMIINRKCGLYGKNEMD